MSRMDVTDFLDFIRGIPKAELHVHIEGTLRPEMMLALAKRNDIELGSKAFPYKTIEEINAAYKVGGRFKDLQEFLDVYDPGSSVLQTRQDFYDLAMDYFERAHHDGVRHAEVFFDPQNHTDRGIPYETVIKGLADAAADAQEKFGISIYYIHSFMRHLSEESAFESLKMAEPYLGLSRYRIVGVGLDSSENDEHPPEKFARVFKRAKDMGLFRVAHAGEEGAADYVWQALDVLDVNRVDHGNRSLEDADLVEHLAQQGITLTVCPLSTYKLNGILDLKDHFIRVMLDARLMATMNSDDPGYFGGLVENFVVLYDLGVIDEADCVTLVRNSITGSFLPERHQKQLLQEIDAFVAARPGLASVAPRAAYTIPGP